MLHAEPLALVHGQVLRRANHVLDLPPVELLLREDSEVVVREGVGAEVAAGRRVLLVFGGLVVLVGLVGCLVLELVGLFSLRFHLRLHLCLCCRLRLNLRQRIRRLLHPIKKHPENGLLGILIQRIVPKRNVNPALERLVKRLDAIRRQEKDPLEVLQLPQEYTHQRVAVDVLHVALL